MKFICDTKADGQDGMDRLAVCSEWSKRDCSSSSGQRAAASAGSSITKDSGDELELCVCGV